MALAKREVFDIPFFSTVIRRAGFIPIQRGDRARTPRRRDADDGGAARAARACSCSRKARARGPGELGPFKKGGFVAAIEAGSRIVPVAVHGTARAHAPARLRAAAGQVRVGVLDPVEAGAVQLRRSRQLIAEVRGRIAAALRRRRRPGGERSVA